MKTNKNRKRTLSCALAAAMAAGLFTGCGTVAEDTSQPEATGGTPATETVMPDYDFTVSYDGIATGNVSSGVSVHDPSIVKDNGTYYIFGSHMAAAKCDDLKSWKSMADGYTTSNPVYGQIYDVKEDAFAYAGDKISLIQTDDKKTHVWAPDVIYNKTTRLFYMYYCTTSTWNASNLCYGTSETIEGPYEWQGALIYSGFNKDTIQATDVLDYVDEEYALKHYVRNNGYNVDEYPNAIDPSVFYDEDDRMWMVYGSWSGGIYLLELDPATGLVIHPEADPDNNVDAYYGKRLLGGGHKSIEGPYILYEKERYPVLSSNAEAGVYGPGHNSFTTDEDGNDILVYHARTETEIVGDPLYNPNRHTMLMKFGWRDGRPVFDYS